MRSGPGFTLIELLVVIAIQGILIIMLPPVQGQRQKFNQTSADGAVKQIASEQSISRNVDSDGDGLDDYGSLAELATFGLLNPDVADGIFAGYSITLSLFAGPGYQARAIPLVAKVGILRFFVDQTGVVRWSQVGIPGPSDPPVVIGSECNLPDTPEQLACDIHFESAAKFAIGASNALGGGGHIIEAIQLLDETSLYAALLLALDEDGSDTYSEAELIDRDLFAVAKAVAASLAVPSGPDLGADSDLALVLSTYQDEIQADLALDVDGHTIALPVTEMAGREEDLIALLLSALPSVPALSAGGLAALAGVLTLLGGASLRRARRA